MAPRRTADSSDSESDAPEAVSVSTTKKEAIEREAALREFSAGEKLKKKAENRARDEKLKEQRKRGDEGLEERMRRAMEDAEDESGEEEEEFMGIGMEEDMGSDEDEDEDETMMSDEEDEEVVKPNYLPEHLFASAAPKKTTPSSKTKTAEPSKRRKKRRNTTKEVVIGSRTIRTLSPSTLPSPQNVSHNAKARRFLKRSLSKPRGREGWDRRPASVGVMRRTNGPAAQFVRTS